MASLIYYYPVDLTGRQPTNYVSLEPHLLVEYQDVPVRVFQLNHGGFYTRDLKIRDDSGRELRSHQDYIATFTYEDMSHRTGLEVCGVIVITNPAITGIVRVSAQMVGGDLAFTLDAQEQVIDHITAHPTDPITWAGIVGEARQYGPGELQAELWERVGYQAVNTSLEDMARALKDGNQERLMDYRELARTQYQAFLDLFGSQLSDHVADLDNPHQVTKTQVGLGLVEDYPFSTEAQARSGTQVESYLTPLSTAQAIDEYVTQPLHAHVAGTGGGGGGSASAEIVQARLGSSLQTPTTVGNALFWIVYSYNAPTAVDDHPVPLGESWTLVGRQTFTEWNGAVYGVSMWACGVTVSTSDYMTTHEEHLQSGRLIEVSGLDVSALSTPLSISSVQAGGTYPASALTNITDPYAFALLACHTTAGAGGTPDLYTWWTSNQGDMGWGYTPTIFSDDQSMNGGGVSSGTVMIITAAFRTGGGTVGDNPHQVTAAQLGALDRGAVDALTATKLNVNDPAVNALAIVHNGQSLPYVSFYNAARTAIPAGNIGNGVLNPARLALGGATASTLLRGDGTWTSIQALVNQYAPVTGASVYYIGYQGRDTDGMAHINATFTSVSNYPIGTIILFRAYDRQIFYIGDDYSDKITLQTLRAAIRTAGGWSNYGGPPSRSGENMHGSWKYFN